MNKVKKFSVFLAAILLAATCVLSLGFLGNRKVASAQTIRSVDATVNTPFYMGTEICYAVVSHNFRIKGKEEGLLFQLASNNDNKVDALVETYLTSNAQFTYANVVEFPIGLPSDRTSDFLKYARAARMYTEDVSEWVYFNSDAHTGHTVYKSINGRTLRPGTAYVEPHELQPGQNLYMSFVFHTIVYDYDWVVPNAGAGTYKTIEEDMECYDATEGVEYSNHVTLLVTSTDLIVTVSEELTLRSMMTVSNGIFLARD